MSVKPVERTESEAIAAGGARAPALTVDAHGVSLTFQTRDGEVQALADIDLQISEGDFVSFIGPSGCGKTTLLRVIADLEQPTRGHHSGQRRHAGRSPAARANTATSSRRRRFIRGAPSSAT